MYSQLTIQSFWTFTLYFSPDSRLDPRRRTKRSQFEKWRRTKIDIRFSFLWFFFLSVFSFFQHFQITTMYRAHVRRNIAAHKRHISIFSPHISHYYSERCTTTIIFSFHHSFVPFRFTQSHHPNIERNYSWKILDSMTTKLCDVCMRAIVLSFIGFRFVCAVASARLLWMER